MTSIERKQQLKNLLERFDQNPIVFPDNISDLGRMGEFLLSYLGNCFVQGYRLVEKISTNMFLLSLMNVNQFKKQMTDNGSDFRLVCVEFEQKAMEERKIRAEKFQQIDGIIKFFCADSVDGTLEQDIQIIFVFAKTFMVTKKLTLESLQKCSPLSLKSFYHRDYKIHNKADSQGGFRILNEVQQGKKLHELVEMFIKGSGSICNEKHIYKSVYHHSRFCYNVQKVINTVCLIIGKQMVQGGFVTMSSQKWMRKFSEKKFKKFDLLLRNEKKVCIIDWKFSRLNANEKISTQQFTKKNKQYFQLARKQYNAQVELRFYCFNQSFTSHFHEYSFANYHYDIDKVEINDHEYFVNEDNQIEIDDSEDEQTSRRFSENQQTIRKDSSCSHRRRKESQKWSTHKTRPKQMDGHFKNKDGSEIIDIEDQLEDKQNSLKNPKSSNVINIDEQICINIEENDQIVSERQAANISKQPLNLQNLEQKQKEIIEGSAELVNDLVTPQGEKLLDSSVSSVIFHNSSLEVKGQKNIALTQVFKMVNETNNEQIDEVPVDNLKIKQFSVLLERQYKSQREQQMQIQQVKERDLQNQQRKFDIEEKTKHFSVIFSNRQEDNEIVHGKQNEQLDNEDSKNGLQGKRENDSNEIKKKKKSKKSKKWKHKSKKGKAKNHLSLILNQSHNRSPSNYLQISIDSSSEDQGKRMQKKVRQIKKHQHAENDQQGRIQKPKCKSRTIFHINSQRKRHNFVGAIDGLNKNNKIIDLEDEECIVID